MGYLFFFRNTLLSLIPTFTPGSRPVQPVWPAGLWAAPLDAFIAWIMRWRDNGARFWTIPPGRPSRCCSGLFTREVAEVVVWRRHRERDSNAAPLLGSPHLASRCVKWVWNFHKVGWIVTNSPDQARRQRGVRSSQTPVGRAPVLFRETHPAGLGSNPRPPAHEWFL